jgi:hypothetical protein
MGRAKCSFPDVHADFLQNVVNVDEAYKAKITMIHKSTKLSWIPIQDYFIRKQANKPFR